MKENFVLQKSVPVIDQLRGLASFSVCLYHIICTTTGFIHTPWILSLFSYGRYGVQIFFVISGFVIPFSLIKSGYKINQIHRFMIKRFVRIEPPYIIAIFIALAYAYLREYIPGTVNIDIKPKASDVLLHFGYLIPFFENAKWLNDVFWTLAVEFQYYLLLAILLPFLIHKELCLRILTYSIFYGLSFLFPETKFITFWGPLFMIGISYCLYLFNKIMFIELLILQLFSAAYIIAFINIESFVFGYLTLFIIVFFPTIKSAFFSYLGKISYSLYLIHCLSGVLFVNLASHYANSIFIKCIIILGGILISIISAHILYLLVEKPSKHYSSKLKL